MWMAWIREKLFIYVCWFLQKSNIIFNCFIDTKVSRNGVVCCNVNFTDGGIWFISSLLSSIISFIVWSNRNISLTDLKCSLVAFLLLLLFNKSAPMPIQWKSCNVRFHLLSVFLSVGDGNQKSRRLLVTESCWFLGVLNL